jgi:hypothetical protein
VTQLATEGSLAVCAARDDRIPVLLLLRLWRRFGDRFLGEGLYSLEFLLETAAEIVGAILEKHDKTKREKHEKNEPEKAAKQRHGVMLT